MEKRIIGRDLLFLFVIICIAFVPSVVFASGVNSNAQISLNVARKTLCDQIYQVKTDSSIQLRWNEVEDADCYRLQRVSSTGKIISTETISSDKTECEVKDLKPSSSYYFRIYARKNGSTIAKSKRLKVNTFSKTTGYFYRKVVVDEEWPGVLITSKKATAEQINKFNNLDQSSKPSIKYNYVIGEKKLYINAYVDFLGEGRNKLYEDYEYSRKEGKYVKVSTDERTYEQVIKEGIQSCWSIKIKGNGYDFEPGVNFSTKVNLIEEKLPDQNYIAIFVGDEEKRYKEDGMFWFFSEGALISRSSTQGTYYNYRANEFSPYIVMPTQEQVVRPKIDNSNPYRPKVTLKAPRPDIDSYKKTAAHEFGHLLGIDDAYANSYRPIKQTKEIAYVGSDKKSYGVMISSKADYAAPNDVEMALYAQGMAIKDNIYSWQAYTNYVSPKGLNYIQSKAIRLEA